MQKFTRIAALLLVTIAIMLAVLAFSVGRRVARPVAGGTSTTPSVDATSSASASVVVAVTTLPAGTPLLASSLQVAKWAQRPADAFGAVSAVVGSVPLIDIPAGTAITGKLLARGVAMALKPGERAIAVPVDETTAAGNRVLPGDYVDVFVSLKAPSTLSLQPGAHDSAVDTSQTRLLLSRLRVLAYGDDDLPPLSGASTPPPAPADGKAAAPGGDENARQISLPSTTPSANKSAAHTAVLAVPVGEANQLLLAVQNGKLSLGVRAPSDDGAPDDTLFAAPQPVLLARTDLSADQKQLLLRPENQAYAGVNGSGLAGQDQPAFKPVRAAGIHASSGGIEIIRGSSVDSARAVRINP